MAAKALTIRQVLDEGLPGKLETAIGLIDLGTSLRKIKATIAADAAAAAKDITAIAAAKIVINEGPDSVKDSGVLPPIGSLKTLRVTGVGTGALGDRILSDAGGAAGAPGANGPGIALISDDNKTLTFEGTVTGFIIEYFAAIGSQLQKGVWTKGVDLNDAYALPSGGIGG